MASFYLTEIQQRVFILKKNFYHEPKDDDSLGSIRGKSLAILSNPLSYHQDFEVDIFKSNYTKKLFKFMKAYPDPILYLSDQYVDRLITENMLLSPTSPRLFMQLHHESYEYYAREYSIEELIADIKPTELLLGGTNMENSEKDLRTHVDQNSLAYFKEHGGDIDLLYAMFYKKYPITFLHELITNEYYDMN